MLVTVPSRILSQSMLSKWDCLVPAKILAATPDNLSSIPACSGWGDLLEGALWPPGPQDGMHAPEPYRINNPNHNNLFSKSKNTKTLAFVTNLIFFPKSCSIFELWPQKLQPIFLWPFSPHPVLGFILCGYSPGVMTLTVCLQLGGRDPGNLLLLHSSPSDNSQARSPCLKI